MPYASFTYNQATNTYTATNLTISGQKFSTVTVKITNDKLSQIVLEGSGVSITIDYTYQNTTVTLPQVDD